MHAGRGLLGDTLELRNNTVPQLRIFLEGVFKDIIQLDLILSPRHNVQDRSIILSFISLVDHQRGVAAIIHDQGRTLATGKRQCLFGTPPVLLQGLALPGKDRDP